MLNMQKRRTLLSAASGLAGFGVMTAPRANTIQNPRERMRQKHFPNVPLVTHAGKNVQFYDDILKGQKVVISFMYTVCSNICTPVTQNILEAQRLLGDFGKDINFYSISLTPLQDDPAALRAYMAMHKIGAGWTFLTGEPRNIDRVRRGLGFADKSPDKDADITSHSGMVRIGNEPSVSWGHASAITNGRAVARMIRFELA